MMRVTNKELLKKHHRKLTLEAVVKSLIVGFSAGLFICLVIAVISFFVHYNCLWLCLGVGVGGSLAIAAGLYFLFFRVDIKEAARRVDASGLDERIITMLEFENDDSFIADLQRKNATEILSTVTKKAVKFSLSRVAIIALCGVAVIAAPMIAVSTVNAINFSNIPPLTHQQPEKDDDEKYIDELIEALRRTIDGADVSAELKKSLHGIVDDLEAALPYYTTTLEKIAVIRDAQRKINALIRAALEEERKDIITIGQALMDIESGNTYDLGFAIESGKTAEVDKAFRKMYGIVDSLFDLAMNDQMSRNTAADILDSYADDIEEALLNATVVEPSMRRALQNLAAAFREAAKKLREVDPEDPDAQEEQSEEAKNELHDAMEQAQQEISDAMDNAPKDDTEQLQDDLNDILDGAVSDLGGDEYQQVEPVEPEEGQPSTEGNQDGYSPSDGSDDELDPDYDKVIDGLTDYITVLPESREEALLLLQSGILPPEIADIIARYFDLLDPS
jgi:hypothetical protein